jgi:hypothetical protein
MEEHLLGLGIRDRDDGPRYDKLMQTLRDYQMAPFLAHFERARA